MNLRPTINVLHVIHFPLAAYGIGCYRDTSRRAIPTLERRSRLLKGNYRRRAGAIRNCALAAARRGYKVFAIQHGGWCASARYAYRTYRKYGKSNRCRNGKGGPWANDVYVLRGEEKSCLSVWQRPLSCFSFRTEGEARMFKCIIIRSYYVGARSRLNILVLI